MSQEQWTAVDTYFSDLFIPSDPVLDAALAASDAAGLPRDQCGAQPGQAAAAAGAEPSGRARILEIGTLGGYSTIWLARALPAGGRLITLEAEPKHAEVARANIARAGLERQRRNARRAGASTHCRSSPPKGRRPST